HVDPDVAQLLAGEQLALAELGHVGQYRHIDGRADRRELFERSERFWKDRVSTRVDEPRRAIDRHLETLHRPDVGAADDHEVRVPPRVDGGADALGSRGVVDHLLAVQMTASLWIDLVLD